MPNSLQMNQNYYFFSDAKGRVAHCCEALRQLSGHHYAALEGSPIDKLLHAQQQTTLSLFELLQTQGDLHNYPVYIQHRQGKTIHALLRLHRVYNDHQQLCGYEGQLQPQHMKNQSSTNTTEQLQDTLEHQPTPLIRLNQAGVVIYANHASMPLLAALGGKLGHVLHQDWHGHIQQALQHKQVLTIDVTTPDMPYHCKFIPQYDELLIAAVAQSDADQQQPIATARVQDNALYLRGIAHDLNNMLGVILGNASLMQRLPDDRSGTEVRLQRIFKAARSAAQLCKALLCQEHPPKEQYTPSSLASIVEQTAAMFQDTMDNDNILLHFQTGQQHLDIQGNPPQIQRVLTNFILNATESMQGSHGQVRISHDMAELNQAYIHQCHGFAAAKPGAYAYIEVEDNGCGISPHHLQHLFEAFHSSKEQGRGLGMCTALSIIQAHQGLIHVSSAAGEGTSIRVLFPMLSADTEHQVHTLLHNIAKRHHHHAPST